MGRILAIDFGTRRVGAALSDPRALIASPLETYERRSPLLDAAHYRQVVEDEGVDRIVVGLPLHTSGAESESATLARGFGAWLGQVTSRPVHFFDERYTSVEADALLRDSGLAKRARKERRDMLAALVLLQAYLDAGAPEHEPPARSLDDAEEIGECAR
jgi:putative Holliday junction resolvase